MRRIAADLRDAGHVVTSRWLETEYPTDRLAVPPKIRAKYAIANLADLDAANACVSFTEPPGGDGGRGGRHVEHGYAMAKHMVCIVVGPKENLFHEHPRTIHLPDTAAFLRWAGLAPPPEPQPDGFAEGLYTTATTPELPEAVGP
jgi:hypothetical protein